MTSGDAPRPEPLAPSARGTIARTPRVLARTPLGAPLEAWEADRDGPGLLVVAGQHGDEGEGVALLSAALRCVPPGALRADVIVALNPDGLARGTRANARGVDLNRNFPAANWTAAPVAYRWTLDAPRDVRLSTGAGPGSEPETRAFLAFLARRRPRTVLSLHAPLAVIDDPEDTALGRTLAARTGLDHVADVGYPTPGSFGTWGREHGVEVVTWELEDAPREALLRANLPVLFDVLVGRY